MKTPRKWSQVLECELAEKAKAYMDSNRSRLYHNWEHVCRLVFHAEHTFDFTFDLPLAKAIIAHDVIYDADPQKEWRSAEWLLDVDGGSPTNIQAVKHIMKTDGHRLSADNRMVLLDLADFMFPKNTHDNFYKVMMESMNLYGVQPDVVASKGKDVLHQLHDQYSDDRLQKLTPMERVAFVGIRTGLERAIMAYDEALKGAKRGG